MGNGHPQNKRRMGKNRFGISQRLFSPMKKETIQQYYENLLKLEKDEWNQQQWQDYCMVVLGEIMEEHKDVFVRLKERK
jgi:hydrogenase maturation factor HypE